MSGEDQNTDLILDLTTRDSSEVKSTVIEKSPFDPKEAREKVRSQIAILLIVLLFLTVFFSFCIFVYDADRAEVKDLLALIFTPLVGIVGTVLGFYFGSETAKE